jgi:uracil-DNA glycosylase family 4
VGKIDANLLFVGEAAGSDEAWQGEPFVGAAGSMLQRLFNLLGWRREDQRIDNVCRCQPPENWLEGAPWEQSATQHCSSVHLSQTLAEPHKIVVALGNTALRNLLGLSKSKGASVRDFHGLPVLDPRDQTGQKIVVGTFHPSFLQRGANNLIGTVLWDLQQAEIASREGIPEPTHTIIVDPPIGWFRAWVDQVIAARLHDPFAYPISSDIETPDKAKGQDEGELGVEDRSFIILRVNVACHPDEGITVPWVEPYISELKRLHQSPGPIYGWNYLGYDFDRCMASGLLQESDFSRCYDLMWWWHRLQSDLPRGLGFVAPFYSRGVGPWKHLAESEPGQYAAIDAVQTHRLGFGITSDLQQTGLLDSVMRYVHDLHWKALRPAQIVGVQIDRPQLVKFKVELGQKATSLLEKISACVPEELLPLTPKQGLTKQPQENVLHVKATAFTRKGEKRAGKEASEVKLDLYKRARVVECTIERDVLVCTACGAVEIQRRHRCADKGATPDPQLQRRAVVRWYWQEPFNPDSPEQVLAYIKYRKHPIGKAKKTQKDSTNKETLKNLTKTGDPFYTHLLNYRAVIKAKGTYADGTEHLLDDQDRVHPEPTFVPSTARLSYKHPNITNVIADKSGKDNIAAGFRKCVVPFPSHRLLEVDFGGSEAVDFGWLIKDPNHIRLAALGLHSGLASYFLAEKHPKVWKVFDPGWDDQTLGAYFKSIKESDDQEVKETYDRAKRFCHGFAYGLSVPGMVLQFPEFFPTQTVAEKYAALYRQLSPNAIPWHRACRERAFDKKYLGGPGDVTKDRWAHPFGFKHWFWSVYQYKKITAAQYWKALSVCRRKGIPDDAAPLKEMNGNYFKIALGEDGKRCIAFMPQSITAGKLQEVMLRLFDPESPSYLGTIANGLTPLYAPIHDSLLLNIPTRVFDLVAEVVFREMQRPFEQMPCPEEWGFGPYLSTPVSAKTGKVGASWAELEKLSVPKFAELGVASDRIYTPPVEDEESDAEDFAREIA